MPVSTFAPTSALHPLDACYQRMNRSLPPYRVVTADQMPDPYRQLLAHDRDMTSTLESFHGRPIHLEVLQKTVEGDILERQVVLRLDQTDAAVEFGAIRVRLDCFNEPWKKEVMECYRPLGGILNRSGMNYSSRPSAFFAITADRFLGEALGMPVGTELFGRQNTLRTETGDVIADIIEILPGMS